ncbi:MAG: hypothetical protein HY081_10950 [Gammaproteobacteria bacterium]|nr:hypothetical protein [Gammaproteobacteria bacterium]
MEFFAVVNKHIEASALQERLNIASLPKFCASISRLLAHENNRGEIYCVWGQFIVQRELISGGVRFTLPNCLNTLAWTVTTGLPPTPEKIIVHCTINRREQDAEFVETLHGFVEDWRRGLEALL